MVILKLFTLPYLPMLNLHIYSKQLARGISENNLEIKHNKGKAREALASDSQSVFSKVINYIFFSIIIFYLLSSFPARKLNGN